MTASSALLSAAVLCTAAFIWVRLREKRLLGRVQRLSALLMASNQELELRNIEVKRATQLQGRLFAWITHELRTPITVILGFCEVAMLDQNGERTDDPQKAYLGKIQVAGKHLLKIVNDVLDISKLDAGQLRFNITALDLKEIIDQIFDLLSPLAQSQSVRLESKASPGIRVLADRDRLNQIFYNLLGNALCFTPAGGSVTVHAEIVGEQAEIRVVDTGAGMTLQDQSVIFEEFRQVVKGHASVKGTGLGLTITKDLVERQGGRIWVDSTPGQGSSFIFTLPNAALVFEPEIYDPQMAETQADLPAGNSEAQSKRLSRASAG